MSEVLITRDVAPVEESHWEPVEPTIPETEATSTARTEAQEAITQYLDTQDLGDTETALIDGIFESEDTPEEYAWETLGSFAETQASQIRSLEQFQYGEQQKEEYPEAAEFVHYLQETKQLEVDEHGSIQSLQVDGQMVPFNRLSATFKPITPERFVTFDRFPRLMIAQDQISGEYFESSFISRLDQETVSFVEQWSQERQDAHSREKQAQLNAFADSEEGRIEFEESEEVARSSDAELNAFADSEESKITFETSEISLDALRENLSHSRTQVSVAEEKLARLESSLVAKFVSKDKLEAARAEVETLQATYQGQVETLRSTLEVNELRGVTKQLYQSELKDLHAKRLEAHEDQKTQLERAGDTAQKWYQDTIGKQTGWKGFASKAAFWTVASAATFGAAGGAKAGYKISNWLDKRSSKKEFTEQSQSLEEMSQDQLEQALSRVEAYHRLEGTYPPGTESEDGVSLHDRLIDRLSTQYTESQDSIQEQADQEVLKGWTDRLGSLRVQAVQDFQKRRNVSYVAGVAGGVVGLIGITTIAGAGIRYVSDGVEVADGVGIDSIPEVSEEIISNSAEAPVEAVDSAIEASGELDVPVTEYVPTDLDILDKGETIWGEIAEELGVGANDIEVAGIVNEYLVTDIGKETVWELASETHSGQDLIQEFGLTSATDMSLEQSIQLSEHLAPGELSGLVDFMDSLSQTTVENIPEVDPDLLLDNLEGARNTISLEEGLKPLEVVENHLARTFRNLNYDSNLSKQALDEYVLNTRSGQEWVYNSIVNNPDNTPLVQEVQQYFVDEGIKRPRDLERILVDSKGNPNAQLFWMKLSRAMAPGEMNGINEAIESVIRSSNP